MNGAETIVSVQQLGKCYGKFVAVNDVSFTVEQGEVFGLIGPNGCGKTTTVECLQGLRRLDRGTVRILGLDPVTQGDQLRRRIGSQLQDSALPDRIRVWEALDLFASLSSRATDRDSLLKEWGFEHKRNASFASLSGGQKQRLFIALALLNTPEVVFLDEMTTGLDPGARRVVWDLIDEIRASGTTIILVTHFMEEAERLCDRVAVLRAGLVIALDTPSRLAAQYGGLARIMFSSDSRQLEWIERLPGAERMERRGSAVVVHGSSSVLPLLAAGLVERGIVPADLRVEQPRLEDAFLALVGPEDE